MAHVHGSPPTGLRQSARRRSKWTRTPVHMTVTILPARSSWTGTDTFSVTAVLASDGITATVLSARRRKVRIARQPVGFDGPVSNLVFDLLPPDNAFLIRHSGSWRHRTIRTSSVSSPTVLRQDWPRLPRVASWCVPWSRASEDRFKSDVRRLAKLRRRRPSS